MTDPVTSPELTREWLDELIDEVWPDTHQHTLQRYGARKLRDAILANQPAPHPPCQYCGKENCNE